MHHAYKLSIKLDGDNWPIKDFKTTLSSQHDLTIHQIESGDMAVYRDKGYFGDPDLLDKSSWLKAILYSKR